MENNNPVATKTIDPREPLELPLLPLRDVVIYPHMVIPLFVGRDRSIQALEFSTSADKQIFLVTQKNASIDDPASGDMYAVGCVATVLQLLKLPDGTVKVLVEGIHRAKILKFLDKQSYSAALVEVLEETPSSDREAEILVRSVLEQFDNYLKLNKKIPPEIMSSIASIEEPSRLADTIAAHMSLKLDEKQTLLEATSLKERLEKLLGLLEAEIDLLQVEKRIRGRVKKQMEKSQREYYLNEQMKAIQKELGEMENVPNELEELQKKIKESGLSKEAQDKAQSELNKLKMMPPMSAEATVSRNYLDWIIGLPWKTQTKINKDLTKAEKTLEADHYGLDKVKERIIEYLAVQQRVKKLKGPVLCLVGPPGVGKTSLGESVAKATGRKFVRMSLGGVRDEAEIRGHRRTYIGSMPGKIIQKLAKIGARNCLFLLDEIDKMAMDFRGDPASALLEVLDPEQNNTFNDHYLEVDFDLSDIMFICTANSMNIPGPLLDRMEVIRIPGYIEDEKMKIAFRHLIPKQIEENGLKSTEIEITEGAVREILRYYTREAGVRSLEREIAKICRKVVRQILIKKTKKKTHITQRNIEKYLGVKKYRYGIAEDQDRVGEVNGLAWTEVGGELLSIEAVAMVGKGKTSFTGQLGEVMQESIQAAMTVVRSRSTLLGIEKDFYEKVDIHIHVPEGATPKDGPSAGIGMCTALVSALTGIPVRADIAMTGEITLRGEVLPIGGLKEKLLAALRARIKTVIIPEDNKRDLKEIPEDILQDLDIRPVKWIDEVLTLALLRKPEPLPVEESTLKTPLASGTEEKKKKDGRTSTH